MRSVNTKLFRVAMINADIKTFGELEEKTGINRSTLGDIARGDQKPSYDTIVKIAEACGLAYEGIGRVFFDDGLHE